ncbi:CNPV015 ankyrin repeat protein [Canarypox virus]|uniref:CNPV015 ankyrin repeat protein n=1 Tax=Canarypox virus TaxID=44088 RepID=Q6VZY2_CNPV|nr:CNPV015 ankyrin repeat protein [Canarypox virus]AAR83361.1 CNPV015 ankyrin repeat protein [Canarypox virus]AWD84491.1 ankyrin repeat protein [Canarypox virus]
MFDYALDYLSYTMDVLEKSFDVLDTLLENNNTLIDLLRNGYEVNEMIKTKTLLHRAVELRNIEAVKTLLLYGSDPFVKHSYLYQNALHTACMLLPLSKMETISHIRNNTIRQPCYYAYAPLEKNAENESIKIAELLLSKYPDLVNHVDHEHRTPLHLAVESNNIKMLKVLLSYGADINTVDNAGKTPICCAVIRNLIDVTKELISLGADINKGDINNMTPLHHIVRFAKSTELIEILLDHGANINAVNNFGETPLHVLNGARDHIATTLITRGANVYAVDYNGNTLLHKAVINSNAMLVNLIKLGVDVNHRNNSGKTPLHYAVKYPLKKSVSILLKHGADVNIMDNNWDTPLSYKHFHRKWLPHNDYKSIIDVISIIMLEGINKRYKCLEGHNVNIKTLENVRIYKRIKDQCEKEILMLRNTKLCNGVIADIILTENNHNLTRFIRNPNFNALIHNFNFKVYKKLINNVIMSARSRFMLMNRSVNLIQNHEIFGKLPEDVLWNISKYLEADDVKTLENVLFTQLNVKK